MEGNHDLSEELIQRLSSGGGLGKCVDIHKQTAGRIHFM